MIIAGVDDTGDQDRRASPIERELGYEAVVSGEGHDAREPICEHDILRSIDGQRASRPHRQVRVAAVSFAGVRLRPVRIFPAQDRVALRHLRRLRRQPQQRAERSDAAALFHRQRLFHLGAVAFQ
jgi:hypothetical protein